MSFSLCVSSETALTILCACCLIPRCVFGSCENPYAISAFRKSLDDTNMQNDKPSHAVIRLRTAECDCSLFCIRYLHIGPAPAAAAVFAEAVDVDCCGSLGTFRFSMLTLRTLFICSCSPFVKPPVVFSMVRHILHSAVYHIFLSN